MRFITATGVLLSLLSVNALSAPQSPSQTSANSVPRLIPVTGVFAPANGEPANQVETVTVGIYNEQEGGTPIWQETQRVLVDEKGRYSLLLGATQPGGVPTWVTASSAEWLGVLFERTGEVERPRVRLTSVPYALRSADADTLGGRPASDYLLAPGTRAGIRTADNVEASVGSPAGELPGTPNVVAKYVDASNVGPSSVYESGGLVGVGTSTPFDNLHVRFTNTGGTMTGFAVQNLGNTATSYSGMLFYDQNGALGQFQGFNNVTHEYRINNIASGGSINFMLGGVSRFKVDPAVGIGISGPVGILAGSPTIGLLVSTAGSQGISVGNTNPTGTGIYSDSGTSFGMFGSTDTGIAVAGYASDAAVGWAGYFDGDLGVTGTLYKGAGAFRIDHPLDPEHKYLNHSFVESPDMKNIYDGVAVLDGTGEATVILPEWFEALNQDFRYQLTPMGAAFVPYVAEEVLGNTFKIAGGIPGKKVSWQLTGIRHDAFANANRIQVEELKSDSAAGTYLHPEAFALSHDHGRPKSPKDSETPSEAAQARLRAIAQKPARR